MTPKQAIEREDRDWLMKQPQFLRTLFEIYNAAGITSVTREEQHALFLEGKRSLGFEILGWFGTEPHAVIATAAAARMIFTKGAQRDRSDEPATDD